MREFGLKTEKLPRDIVIIDHKGRLTIPQFMREKLEIPIGEKSAVILELYPPENPKKILLEPIK